MARQLANTRRTNFEGFEGWGEDCYVVWRPFTVEDTMALKNINTDISEEEGFELILKGVTDHVVSGKVKIFDDAGDENLVDLEKEDVRQFPLEFIMDLYSKMTGARLDDPKVSQTEAESKS